MSASLSSGKKPDPPEASGPSAVPLLTAPLISQQPRAGRGDDNGQLISGHAQWVRHLQIFRAIP